MAEHSAVNRVVVGSSPTWGAIEKHLRMQVLFVVYNELECMSTVLLHLVVKNHSMVGLYLG